MRLNRRLRRAFSDDYGAGQVVAESFTFSGNQAGDDGDRSETHVDLDDSDESTNERMAKPQRAAVISHRPEAERQLANCASARQCFHGCRIANEHGDGSDEEADIGKYVISDRGDGADEEYQCAQGDHLQGEVNQEGEASARKLGEAQIDDNGVTCDQSASLAHSGVRSLFRHSRYCAGSMDLDRFVATHRGDWERLRQLTRRSRLSGAEADEFVDLYGRASTDLSVVRSQAPDPVLVAELSTLVARARGTTTGTRRFSTDDIARYFVVTFPLVVYRARWWITAVSVGFVLVAFGVGTWVAANPDVQGALAPPAAVEQLVTEDFENYYSSDPATSFAAKVWTNNAWVAALSLAFGGLLGLPVLWVLWQNASNVGVVGGFMAAGGRLDLFFGLILPHGLLELTAVFVAAGLGLRLGWTLVAPGPRRRVDAFASEGRSTLSAVVGLTVVLFVSGIIEAFVTPSGLPTWARITIGALALAAFLGYVAVLGRRAEQLGLGADLDEDDAGSIRPVSA